MRPDAAVIHGEFLEVAQDAEREHCRTRIAAELEGGAGVVLDVDRGLLGFDKELARAANAKAVVGRFVAVADVDGVLVNDILVSFAVALFVLHVPSQRLKKGFRNSFRNCASL